MSDELVHTSPNVFSLRQRIILVVVPPLITWLFRALLATCRTETRGQEHWDKLYNTGQHFLVGFWHESLGLVANYHRNSGFHTLTSQSFDGELAARVVRCFGMRALRGSSHRGGMRALRDLQRATKAVQVVGFTIDGPRGPRRVAKPGLAILSVKTGFPILPQAVEVERAWRLRSWDRMPIPKPFTRIVHEFGPPIPAPPEATAETFESTRLAVESALNSLHKGLEDELHDQRDDPRTP